ncbi:MAG: T9SS type A sorting domain-containing protein [Bacteroidetes bacterium]|nr:T9SS type A sorting domain-containing protein [Bacteroidota bacterium]
MKRYLFAILILFFSLTIKGQISDSLNINLNPFFKRTSVYFSFTNNDTVSLTVYNQLGQVQFAILTASVMSSGIYKDSLIMDSYPDGQYFVHLKLGQRKTLAKRIIKTVTAAIIENTIGLENIKIYPNPFNDKILVELNNSDQLIISNYLGQTVYHLTHLTPRQEIDLSSFSRGAYFLIAKSNSSQKVFKIIKE